VSSALSSSDFYSDEFRKVFKSECSGFPLPELNAARVNLEGVVDGEDTICHGKCAGTKGHVHRRGSYVGLGYDRLLNGESLSVSSSEDMSKASFLQRVDQMRCPLTRCVWTYCL
jgi:hypothetical protein